MSLMNDNRTVIQQELIKLIAKSTDLGSKSESMNRVGREMLNSVNSKKRGLTMIRKAGDMANEKSTIDQKIRFLNSFL